MDDIAEIRELLFETLSRAGHHVALASSGGEALALAISGFGLPQDRQRAEEAGFDAHFTKPVSIDRLLAALE